MEYRKCGRVPLDISAVGIGCEGLDGKSDEEVSAIFDACLAEGMNYLDLFMPQPDVRSAIGKALAGRRDKMIIQGHLCTTMNNGQYERTRDLAVTKTMFQDLLDRLQTDYIDVGMLHYVDTDEDYASVFDSEIIAYARELKEKGVIRYIGMSSHNPEVAMRAVLSGDIDILMFSINPAYELEDSATDIYEQVDFAAFKKPSCRLNTSRQDLYAACETHGVGIVVMKPFAAGRLLTDEGSPFGKALTPAACITFALSRPGVVSVLPGVASPEEVHVAAAALTASDAEKEYASVITACPKVSLAGKCMYCGHCLPCSSAINIPMVAKLVDMALASDETPESVQGHYDAMKFTAKDCIECRHCESQCPFGVSGAELMKRARRIFGN